MRLSNLRVSVRFRKSPAAAWGTKRTPAVPESCHPLTANAPSKIGTVGFHGSDFIPPSVCAENAFLEIHASVIKRFRCDIQIAWPTDRTGEDTSLCKQIPIAQRPEWFSVEVSGGRSDLWHKTGTARIFEI
jgi:hypothetical protein